ncbi:MAG: metal-sensitive transcriptional regulator [Chloroflexi bacterium]|nr:metal-sensitive transcriptional regulator [Chloroflexota bacterium]
MKQEYKKEAALRLKIAAGHLEGVRRMVDDETYCVDLMKQLSAVQASLEKVQQIFLRNHLSTCVSDAIKDGMGEEIIDELMGALKFNKSLTDGRAARVPDGVPATPLVDAGALPADRGCCGAHAHAETAAVMTAAAER